MPTGLAWQTAVIINTAISRELRDLARGQVLEVDCPLTLTATGPYELMMQLSELIISLSSS